MNGSSALTDNHVVLIGRPPLGEFLGFIRTMAVGGQSADQGRLTQEWRAANDHVIALENAEAGIADGLTPTPLPPELKPLTDQVRSDPGFQRTFESLPTEFGMVELDRLVVFQKFINLGYVEELKKTLAAKPTDADLTRFALGIGRQPPSVHHMQNNFNTYTFSSVSKDFRFLEAILLQPNQVSVPKTTGQPEAYLAIVIGFGANLLNVISMENRLVLNNGSHRAYCLLDVGIRRAPCVVQRVTRRDELELVGGELQQNPDRYLKIARPSLLRDYFDAKLRKVISVPRTRRSLKVQFGVEPSDVPA